MWVPLANTRLPATEPGQGPGPATCFVLQLAATPGGTAGAPTRCRLAPPRPSHHVQRQGLLNVSDPVADFFDPEDYPILGAQRWCPRLNTSAPGSPCETVALSHLLSHTSGLPDSLRCAAAAAAAAAAAVASATHDGAGTALRTGAWRGQPARLARLAALLPQGPACTWAPPRHLQLPGGQQGQRAALDASLLPGRRPYQLLTCVQ